MHINIVFPNGAPAIRNEATYCKTKHEKKNIENKNDTTILDKSNEYLDTGNDSKNLLDYEGGYVTRVTDKIEAIKTANIAKNGMNEA